MFYVYFIRNTVTRETYVGYTSDLRRRFAEHRAKNPKLIYYEAYVAESDARRRERMLKQRGQSIRRLKERVRDSLV